MEKKRGSQCDTEEEQAGSTMLNKEGEVANRAKNKGAMGVSMVEETKETEVVNREETGSWHILIRTGFIMTKEFALSIL